MRFLREFERVVEEHRTIIGVVGGGLLSLLIGASGAVIAFKANEIANLQAALQERQTRIMERDLLPLFSFAVEWVAPESVSPGEKATYPRIEISNLGAFVEEIHVRTQDYLQVSVWEPFGWKQGMAIPCRLFRADLDSANAAGTFCRVTPEYQQSELLLEGYAEWAVYTYEVFEKAGNYGSLGLGTLITVCYRQLGEYRCEQHWVDYEGAQRVTDGNPMRFIQQSGYFNLVLDHSAVQHEAFVQGAGSYAGYASLFSLHPLGFWTLVGELTGVPVKGLPSE